MSADPSSNPNPYAVTGPGYEVPNDPVSETAKGGSWARFIGVFLMLSAMVTLLGTWSFSSMGEIALRLQDSPGIPLWLSVSMGVVQSPLFFVAGLFIMLLPGSIFTYGLQSTPDNLVKVARAMQRAFFLVVLVAIFFLAKQVISFYFAV